MIRIHTRACVVVDIEARIIVLRPLTVDIRQSLLIKSATRDAQAVDCTRDALGTEAVDRLVKAKQSWCRCTELWRIVGITKIAGVPLIPAGTDEEAEI